VEVVLLPLTGNATHSTFSEVSEQPNNQQAMKTRKFKSGAIRSDNTNKNRFDLISVKFLRGLAWHLKRGGKRVGDNNWKKGFPNDSVKESMLRHMIELMDGNHTAEHLGGVAFGIMVLMDNTFEEVDWEDWGNS